MSPPTQEGDPRPCPEGCVSTGNSTIYNHRLSYEHTAMDYQVKDPNQGC